MPKELLDSKSICLYSSAETFSETYDGYPNPRHYDHHYYDHDDYHRGTSAWEGTGSVRIS